MPATPDRFLITSAAPVELTAAGDQAGDGRRLRRFSAVAYNGGAMRPLGFSLPVVVDLGGLTIAAGPRPILLDHNPAKIVGHSESITLDGRILATGVISGAGPHAAEVVAAADNGFPWRVSIGASPEQMELVPRGRKIEANGQTFTGPLHWARKTTLHEISFVAIAADNATAAAISATQGRGVSDMTFDEWLTAAGFDPATISENQRITLKAAFDAQQAAGPTTATTTATPDLAGEVRRVESIRSLCGGQCPEIEAEAIERGYDAGHVRNLLALRAIRAARPTGPMITARPTRANVTGDMIAAATLHHLGLDELAAKEFGDQAAQQARDLRCHSLFDIMRTGMEAFAVDVPRDRGEMIRAGFSTASLTNALGVAANKVVLNSYNNTPNTWRAFAAIKSANDFKSHVGIRPDWKGALEKVGSAGELKHGTIGEETTAFQVATYGKLVGLTRQQVINDDLQIFADAAGNLGKAAMRRLSDLVYETLLANANAFFHADNGNLLTGPTSALSIDAVANAVRAMATQRDSDNNDLDIKAKTLVVPPELQSGATAVLESEFIAAAEGSPTGNSLRRVTGLEVEPRLSNTAKFDDASQTGWYAFAGPGDQPMIVAFLNGKQSPSVEFFGLSSEVNTLGVHWRVFFDFGCALCDHRAAVKSAGA